ncbi:MAG: isocitrate dehydrogenase [Bacteriovoracaceae bacterium]
MTQKITVIKGDGIGPSLVEATIKVFDKLKMPFEYEYVEAGLEAHAHTGELLPEATLNSIAKNKICLKGPLTTPVGEGFKSMNVTLRQKFDLYVNLRPAVSFPGVVSRYENIDLITIRENTEGLYSGEGQTSDGDHAEAKSIVTRQGSERIVEYAFDLAQKLGRKKVTVVHKANILKSTSGLFLKVAREVAAKHPTIEVQEMIVDNCCMQLVMNPYQFDMIVTTNLFGDILSDLAAGLVGGLGMAPAANIGKDIAIFEAVHGSAPDIAGKNIANPSSVMLAGAMMLEHLGYVKEAAKINTAIKDAITKKDRITKDLGGAFGTTDFTQAVLDRI